jgi:LytS/YehU family sensor histidine kinase
LPRYFYPKRFLAFSIYLAIVISVVILVEELYLEKIFYPDTRGTGFPGIFHTLIEVLPIVSILVGFKFAWDAHQKQGQLEQLNSMVAESRLQFLKSQINPHFLFNNLNNLYSYALDNSPKTPTIILELASILRYMLYDCREKMVPLEKEVQCLRDFIQLQELQIEERGSIKFQVKGDYSNKWIAPLILIVFIENAFKHSTSSLSSGIFINTNLKIDKHQLYLSCENNFAMNTNTNELAKGIGLENVRSRLDLLYPDAYQLDIATEQQVYKVNLVLELDKIAQND